MLCGLNEIGTITLFGEDRGFVYLLMEKYSGGKIQKSVSKYLYKRPKRHGKIF
jgi:hypothetical protein